MKKRLGILGAGKLAKIIVDAYKQGFLSDYELVAVLGRNWEHVEGLVNGTEAAACMEMDVFLATKPDIVAEAASVAAVKDHVSTILQNGSNFVALSIGAFADEAFLESVRKTASTYGTKIYLSSGAVGGFDVLRTLALMAQAQEKLGKDEGGTEETGSAMNAKQVFCTHKGPDSLRNTPLFTEELVDGNIQKEGDSTEVFAGNAKEAIGLLPTKVNVAVAASLVGIGVEQTQVSINSTYGMSGDDHCITLEAAGCKTVIDTFSPTADIAAWSVVALLRNLASPIETF